MLFAQDVDGAVMRVDDLPHQREPDARAVRALGGFMQARLAPQRDDERAALAEAGLDTAHIYARDELATGAALLVATGVTDGALLRQPWQQDNVTHTDSIVISAGTVSRTQEAHA